MPMLATAVAAQAADMGLPAYKAAPPSLLTTNWSGFYFGGHAGAAWGSTNDDFNDPTALAPFRWDSGIPVSGPLAGGQIGYNWQSGWMLFGLEADGSWSNITGHGLCNTTTFFMNCSSKIEGLATVTGRVGASIDRRSSTSRAAVPGGAKAKPFPMSLWRRLRPRSRAISP